jgi:protein-tyrosine-phosphatase
MTETFHHQVPTLDQQLARRTAAARLRDEFSTMFGTETIERFLHTSYEQQADRAIVVNFLPLLAERFARQRLKALAKIEHPTGDHPPTVLFLCPHNTGRSQMALGFFSHLVGGQAAVWSGGSKPGTVINPAALNSMHQRGIDISGEYPKPWTDEILQAADLVITMACGDACPIFPGRRYEEWRLPDPEGLDAAAVAPIRDEIEQRVRHLITEMESPLTPCRTGPMHHPSTQSTPQNTAPVHRASSQPTTDAVW